MCVVGCDNSTDNTTVKNEQTQTVSSKTENNANYTSSKACQHNFSKATCTEDGKCLNCGKISEKALGHKWAEATCKTPKKCTQCGITEGNNSEHKDNGNGLCKYCNKDLFLDNFKENFSAKLIISSVGTNNDYLKVKFVNQTGNTVTLNNFVGGNGKLCSNEDCKDLSLESGYEITPTYYRSGKALYFMSNYNSQKYKDMYLDNNSTAYTTLKVNNKNVCIKFSVNGIEAIGYSLDDIGV